jgi:5-methylcytosine-specific restriction endonuclease McrA
MTKKRAERLTGYEVRELGAFEGERLVVKAVGRADFIALRRWLTVCTSSTAARPWSSMAGRCARCRSTRRLEIDHCKYRSHGGTHQVENLEPGCRDCHKLIHRRERSA